MTEIAKNSGYEAVGVRGLTGEDLSSKINIKLPRHSTPMTMHYGSASKYERFADTAHFICDATTDSTSDDYKQPCKKHRVTEVVYDPDSVYQTTDGHAGSCWKVNVVNDEDGSSANYYIRNWIDIVQHYSTNGFRFVEEKN